MNPLSIQTSPSVMYLKSLLKYEALQTVSGLAITNVNYDKAVALLHERYGQKHRIIATYRQALLDLPAPMHTISSLPTFYDRTESYRECSGSVQCKMCGQGQ